jgi:hypothetical protein
MMTISTFQRRSELAASASQTPVYVTGSHLQDLFPPDQTEDASRLLAFGLIGHQPLNRSTEDQLTRFCQKYGIAYRAYHDNKHYVIYKDAV